MKVLFIANAYPDEQHPYFGIYVKEQIDYIRDHYDINTDLFVLNSKSGVRKYLSCKTLYAKIRDFNPDIIHVHYGLTGLPLLLISPFIKKRNVVATYHGSDINTGGIVFFLSKMLIRHADLNIAVSQQIYEKIAKLSKNCAWIPCGVHNLFFEGEERYERRNAVIFPGDPHRTVKNYPLFEEVMRLLVERYKLSPEVIYFDSKSREEIKKALCEAKCLLMTSLSEGSPQVIKEAIVCDTPVVSTPVGDVPYLVENLDNCYFAESAEELAEKVALVFTATHRDYPADRKKALSNAFLCDKIVELYKQLSH